MPKSCTGRTRAGWPARAYSAVLRGSARCRASTPAGCSLSEDLPLAIIIVDTAERTEAFLDEVAGAVGEAGVNVIGSLVTGVLAAWLGFRLATALLVRRRPAGSTLPPAHRVTARKVDCRGNPAL
jgi:Uncharacterized ACR, COG1993